MTAITATRQGFGTSRSRRPSLAQALAQKGIQSLPAEWVRAHKKKVACEQRRGHERLAYFLYIVDFLRHSLSLWYVARILERLTGRATVAVFYALSLLVICNVGGILAMTTKLPFIWLLCIPLPAAILSGIYQFTRPAAIRELHNRWLTSAFKNFIFGFSGIRSDDPPLKLRDRIARAQDVPGAKIFVEHFGSDPFILIERGLIFPERAYIGAWATGNFDLDRF